METQLRLILLTIGIVILIGVTMDVFRRRPSRISNRTPRNELLRASLNPQKNYENWAVHREPKLYKEVEKEPAIQDEPAQDTSYVESKVSSTVNVEPASQVKFNKNLMVITIMARDPGGFDGEELRECLTHADLTYSSKGTFERENYFKIVKVVEPGIFDYEQMVNEKIPGISIIMVVEDLADPAYGFDLMVKTAKQISFVLNGELLDKEFKPLTLNTIEIYRKQLISNE